MASITLGGTATNTSGDLPSVGSTAPAFRLATNELKDVTLDDFAGKKKILNIVPSLDTGVCATSARTFNERAAAKENVVVLTVSSDLPFAMARFCEANGINSVVTLSQFRDSQFAKDYGVEIVDGSFTGLTARAIVVLDEENVVRYTQLVPEVGNEPDYDGALGAV